MAYQVGWFFFLAPYGIIAQPIHTTILPELTAEHRAGDMAAFGRSMRWALDSMVVWLVPLSALCVALAVPAMTVLAFGESKGSGSIELLAAALASLGVGLLPYGAFFLLARAFYVLGESRVPAVVGILAALVGVAIMGIAAATSSSTTTVVALGLAYSVSFLVGSIGLTVILHRRLDAWVLPSLLGRTLAVAAFAGTVAWMLQQWWDPPAGSVRCWRWRCSFRWRVASTWVACSCSGFRSPNACRTLRPRDSAMMNGDAAAGPRHLVGIALPAGHLRQRWCSCAGRGVDAGDSQPRAGVLGADPAVGGSRRVRHSQPRPTPGSFRGG
ncbi:MAG: lipid II flippase MurJ [Microthrixaceae bacterium]